MIDSARKIYQAMQRSGRATPSAANFPELSFLECWWDYENAIKKMQAAERMLCATTRGLLYWSEKEQFIESELGNMIGGDRCHPDYHAIANGLPERQYNEEGKMQEGKE